MPEFMPGLKLSEAYYHEAVKPILQRHFPDLPHSAALIGFGSDVIGFDNQQSTDHMWGPRLILFLSDPDHALWHEQVNQALRLNLPAQFRGYSTDFGAPDEIGVRLRKESQGGPVDHLIEIVTMRDYFHRYLGVDPFAEIGMLDWLTFLEHKLLAVTSGGVFHDDLGLAAVRSRFDYYPKDIWLYLMAADWMKISQEEPFIGRTGDVGDELGSRVLAARMVNTLMHLAFLMEKRYAPYSKWFGSAFQGLHCAPQLGPHLMDALAAADWHTREAALCRVYENMAELHNALGITPAQDTRVDLFHERPYRVIGGEDFAEALCAAIRDEAVRALPPYVGSINQVTASTDVLEQVRICRQMQGLYH